MNKDQVEGKLKDVAGRIERQAGEWTGDPKKQVQGAAKQVEGKLQNALGKVKDATNKESDKNAAAKPPQRMEDLSTPKKRRREKFGAPVASPPLV